LGPRLKVVALIDPNEKVAKAVLDRKRNSFVVSAYKDTRICPNLDDFVSTMKDNERPHAFIIGSPAAFRGSTAQGRDVELQILKHFPKNTPSVSFHVFTFFAVAVPGYDLRSELQSLILLSTDVH
jgi:hypothetical protein